jgi:O-antigen/teichoic acid export membrane protein
MFPAFSTASVQRGRVSFLFESSTKAICIIMLPILLGVVAFAPEGLRLWLGNDFAVNSSWVVRCLAFAIFMNSVAQVPFAHLQGVGRPDITAILHLVELPVYFAALFLLVKADGIRGAALAWLLRVFADTALLFIYSHKIESENGFISSKMPYLLGGGVLLLSAGMLQMPVAMKLLVVIFASCLAALLLWHWALTPVEKSRLVAQFRGARAAE